MALKKLGFVGFVNDKPYFERVYDSYVQNGQPGILAADVYKSKKEAKKRFQDVREVFVKEGKS